MAACILVKSQLIWLLVKKIIIVKNATAYTWDWYCHLVVDRASLAQHLKFANVIFPSNVVIYRVLSQIKDFMNF
jgi:hypothetical protein